MNIGRRLIIILLTLSMGVVLMGAFGSFFLLLPVIAVLRQFSKLALAMGIFTLAA